MIKTVLFDLDGTLLMMRDQAAFLEAYYARLAGWAAAAGYEPRGFLRALETGVNAMLRDADGVRTNETRFWAAFLPAMEADAGSAAQLRETLEAFYARDFGRLGADYAAHEAAVRTVQTLKARGVTLAVATMPLFPREAVWHRLAWAGLTPDDFALITTYEDTRYCKPDPRYYEETAARLGVPPGECLMVGNDVAEDMLPARAAGMGVFLAEDCLINGETETAEVFPRGRFPQALEWILEQLG